MDDLEFMDSPIMSSLDVWQLLFRFAFNSVVMWIIIHWFYYRKARRRDYYFTFALISVSIFFLIFLLGSVKMKIGFALGLFAIFGIIRYRTEQMPVREMTYLFVLIAISVINALSTSISLAELILTNLIFIFCIWFSENNKWLRHVPNKLVQYDKIELIKPDKREELIADLRERTGLNVISVEVGSIDFLRDTALLKIHYEDDENSINTVNNITKIPKGQ